MPRLKVYRTTIGFHDAYVAAPSKKAALEAWGTEKNLFARGAAELVIDEALSRAPLASPGQVIKVSRGGLRDQLAALGPAPKAASKRESSAKGSTSAAADSPAPKRTESNPRPSRAPVDEAEQTLAAARARHEDELAEIRASETELAREKSALQKRHDRDIARLESALARQRGAYAAALRKWQA